MSDRPAGPDPRDDALRAMLEARADRLGASAPRDVLAAVREEMRAPREGAAFAVVPILAGRRKTGSLGWWAAALVAVVVVAVVGGRSLSSPATSTFAPSASSPSSSVAGSPAAGSAATAGPLTVSVVELHRALSDRSLDGRLVLVDSTLRAVPSFCYGSPCARSFALDFVGPVATFAAPTLPVAAAEPGDSFTSLAGTWVVVPHAGALLLVGRMSRPIDQPQPWSTISELKQLVLDPTTALEPVSGWLVRDRATGSGLSIVDAAPAADGSAPGSPRVAVNLPGAAPGIDPSSTVTVGPFLVRTGKGAFPDVVARYDPAGLVSVVMPPITCAQAPSDATLGCADAVAAAAGVDEGISPVTSVEFAFGWYCGDGTFCPIVLGSNGHVIIHHEDPGEDLVVDVGARDGGGVTVVDTGPLATAVPSTAPPGHGDGFVSLATLRAAIRDGSMDGQVVVLPATMEVQVHACAPAPTPAPPGWCAPTYGLDALPGVHAAWTPASAADVGDATWAIVPSGGAVTVLGRLVVGPDHPGGVSSLLGKWPGGGDDLLAITGWLDAVQPVPCASGSPCLAYTHLWSQDPSIGTGTASLSVSVRVVVGEGAAGLDESQPGHGAYLVRHPGTGLTIVARYDPASVIRVVTAPVTCDTPPAGTTGALGCAAAVDAALEARPANEVPVITSIQFQHGWYCPPGSFCVQTSLTTDGHVILREAAPGHDIVVNVRLADDGSVAIVNTGPIPSPSP